MSARRHHHSPSAPAAVDTAVSTPASDRPNNSSWEAAGGVGPAMERVPFHSIVDDRRSEHLSSPMATEVKDYFVGVTNRESRPPEHHPSNAR